MVRVKMCRSARAVLCQWESSLASRAAEFSGDFPCDFDASSSGSEMDFS